MERNIRSKEWAAPPPALTIPCLYYDVYFAYKEIEAYRDWVTHSHADTMWWNQNP